MKPSRPKGKSSATSAPKKPLPRSLIGVGIGSAAVVLVSLAALFGAPFFQRTDAPVQSYKVRRYLPHDPEAFTQGLVFDDGTLYESTGLRGKSTLRRVDMGTGLVLESVELPDTDFGEGLTVWGDHLIQLTWKSDVAYVYDKNTLEKVHEFHYEGEGWGLTHDGHQFIMSGGTSTLRFLNPDTFEVERRLLVKDHGKPVSFLNELEYVKGEVYANVWQSDRIARISPKTGEVLGWIDLQGLLQCAPEKPSKANILNGIAWDAEGDRLFVTGKYWPWLFQIEAK
jgi:glutaminyl-peptide cyclotransferase